jgi:hypothetical protein
MGHKHKQRSFETPRKRAAPQGDGGVGVGKRCVHIEGSSPAMTGWFEVARI